MAINDGSTFLLLVSMLAAYGNLAKSFVAIADIFRVCESPMT